MEEWKEYKYTDLCTLIGGGTPKTSEPSYWGGNIPWLSVKDFGNDEKYVYKTEKTITEAGINNSSTKLLKRDDIIISARGTIGAIAMLASEMAFNQSCFGIRSNDLVEQHFLYYLTKTKINELQKNSHGSVFETITRDTFAKIDCIIPSIVTQTRISNLLSSLDDKIEVNRRINENLEQQAQALFKSWFVDFEPFKNGEFVESELGMIPKGWRVGQIKDIPHTLNTGKRPKGGAITSGVPSIGAEQLKGLCNYDYTKTKYISKEYSQSIPKGKVIGYEVYLNRVGGKPGDYIQNTTMFGEGYPFENCYLNDHVFKLDFMQNRGYNVFIYFTFLTTRIQKYLNACGGKAAIPVINKQNIDDIYVFLPENEYVIKFGESVLPMINMIFKLGVESARLSTLRDTLLPKLMSGELKVGDVLL